MKSSLKVVLVFALAVVAALASSSVGAADPTYLVDLSLAGTSDSPFAATTEGTTRTISGDLLTTREGSFSGSLTNAGFLAPPVCFVCGFGQSFAPTGVLTISLRQGSFSGAVISGSTAELRMPSHFVEIDVHLQLDVSGGTSRFRHAHGVLTLDYTSLTQMGGPGCLPPGEGGDCGVAVDRGTLTGTLQFSPEGKSD